MRPSPTEEPRVTVVVVPRERYSCGPRTLRSIVANTTLPFRLLWIDGQSPAHVRRTLLREVSAAGGRFLSLGRHLSPNEARNAGWRRARTPWVVFVDNDVVVAPGWLEMLVACAEDTGAALVTPLTLFGPPARGHVHVAGGRLALSSHEPGRRRLHEEMGYERRRLDEVRAELRRAPTELAELHCALLRRQTLVDLGGFDAEMRSTREHIDLCLSLQRRGEALWLEPRAQVAYVPAPPLALSDVRFYMLRWSDAWEEHSLEHFIRKWGLERDGSLQRRLARRGWRREHALVQPLVRALAARLPFSVDEEALAGALVAVERRLNRLLTDAHARRVPAGSS